MAASRLSAEALIDASLLTGDPTELRGYQEDTQSHQVAGAVYSGE